MMKKERSLVFIITAFVAAQIAWLGLLGMWIYWYVSNYIIFEKVGEQLSPQLQIDAPNVLTFVGGIILIVGIAFVLTITFRNLTVQRKLTTLYDNFIANITHELKSPLASIQLYLETMSTKSVLPEKQREFIDLMMRDTTRLNKLMNSILEISILEQKKNFHEYHVFEADKAIKQMIAKSAEHYRLSSDSLEVNGSAVCDCVMDNEAMQIVFDNLTSNSIKYSTEKVNITVNLSKNNKKCFVNFTDNGIGINEKDAKKIFGKFHRVYNHTIPNVQGTGLGLYWVKEIIKLHGGKISVRSDGEGKGTTFIIELPIYKSSKKFYINSLLKRTVKKKKRTE
jgi:two-component system phosphate regulon sensor histidine kinase PhoR